MTVAERLPVNDIQSICRRWHVARMAVFGSAVRDDFRGGSDVDLLVEFLPGRTPGLALVDFGEELEKVIGRRVDIVSSKYLKPRLRQGVVDEEQVIYEAR